ncbi:major facilitator superfamily domain-containing protein [Mycena olivaceomarginata]|nr:major facilitator superfamily domain-containing protein [Mycena olivaceomarginata]
MDENMETTALLPKPKQNKPTPLPKLQLGVVMFAQISEPTASQSIYPYINQLVRELDITGGDPRKVGYYAGLETLFYVTEAMTVLQWSRASDHIGRKPILVIGLFGTALSMFCFGMSRTFWALVVSRCLTGLLNGNVGVMKSVMGDLTDRSNRAQALAFLPVVWDLGAAAGFFIGGQLAQPHIQFPSLFSGEFWRDYPYLLPSLATAGLISLSGLVVLLFFKETAPSKTIRNHDDHQDANSPPPDSVVSLGPLPLRHLLTFPIIISVANYIALAFLDISLRSLLPLFFAMPIAIGGLALPPSKIGLILALQSVAIALFQILFFAKLIRRFGERRVMIGGMSMYLFIFAFISIISITARESGLTIIVWALVGCLLSFSVIADMCFGAVFMFLTASAPKNSRGSVNGLGQTLVSVARAIGPALSTSLFSLSAEKNLLGGHAVYAVFFVISVGAVMLATRLPVEVWEE